MKIPLKKVANLLLVTAMLMIGLLFTPASAAGVGEAVLANTEFAPIPGQKISTTVYVREGSKLASIDVKLSYNPALLTLMESECTIQEASICNINGSDIFINYASASNVARQLDLITLTFMVDENLAPGSYADWLTITGGSEDSATTYMGLVSGRPTYGELELVNGFDALFARSMGDALNWNNDGKVNSRDAMYILQHAAHMFEMPEVDKVYANVYRDFNADGSLKVNSRDAVMVLQYAAKMDVVLDDRVTIEFRDVTGNVYVRKSVVKGGRLTNVPAAPRLEGYAAGKWSMSSTEYVEPNFAAVNSAMTVYAYYDPDGCAHQKQVILQKAPTCTEDGNITYLYCAECGKYFADAAGTRELTEEELRVPATGHTVVVDEAVAPTYTECGWTEGSHCSVCGITLKAREKIEPLKKNEYSIIYNIAGNDTYLQSLNIENPNQSFYTEGETLRLQELEVDGYIFEGWFDGQGSSALRVTEIDRNSQGNIKLWAKWTLAEPYQVVFKYDNELASLIDVSECKEFTYNVNSAKALPVLSLPGYTFIGWSDENGKLCDQIEPGTTGNKTFFANWVSDRSKAQMAKNIGKPYIFEDDQQILFTYEIGIIEDVPVCEIVNFGKINANSIGEKRTKEVATEMTEEYITSFSSAVENATTGNATWTLSNGWTDSIQINNEWATQSGMEKQDVETYSKSETNNWFVNTTRGGASTETVIDSNQNYLTVAATDHVYNNYNYDHSEANMKTTEKGWDIGGKVELGTSQSLSANAKASAKASAAAVGVVPGVIGGAEAEAGAEAGVEATVGADQKLTLTGGYQNKTTSVDGSQTSLNLNGGHDINTAINAGAIKQHSAETTNTSTWNNQSGFGNSTTDSYSKSVAQTISQMISEKTGYGKSYIQTGNNSQTQGVSSTNANKDTFSSQVISSKVTKQKEIVEYDTSAAATGYHRWVMAATARVFGVVGYDKKNDSYFTSTYTIMDDDYHRFQDYSYKTAAYDDNMSCVIDFCVPDDIKSYVEGRMLYTKGLEFDLDGYVTAYTGNATAVIIPEYVVLDNLDQTKELVKVVGIRDGVFTGNTKITGVVLSEFITEIPESAFEGCSSLWEIYGASVTKIGANAFAGCEKLNSFTISPDVIEVGSNAFSSTDFLEVKAANTSVVEAALGSGAKEIVVDLKNFDGALDNETLEVSEETVTFTLRAYGKSFENLAIISHAEETKINRLTIRSDSGVPLKIDSNSVVLNQVNVSAKGIAIALCGESTALKLYGAVSVTTEGEKAILCKNVDFDRISGNFSTGIDISGDIVPCGAVSDSKGLVHFVRGRIAESITDEMFYRLLHTYTLFFDTNGGTVDTTEVAAYIGTAIGTLPIPIREYYTFEGWYNAAEGGEKITAETIFNNMGDMTLYAHWVLNQQSDWVEVSNLPDGAQVVERKYTYTQRSYAESGNPSMDGWVHYDTRHTSWTDWSGWATWNPDNGVRNVEWRSVFDHTEWHYYRWTNANHDALYDYPTDQYNCRTLEERWFDRQLPIVPGTNTIAYEGMVNGKIPNANKWIVANSAANVYVDRTFTRDIYRDEWRYRDPVYTYYFYQDSNKESSDYPSGDNISSVAEWVQYRAK